MRQVSLLVVVLCLTACMMTSAPDDAGRVPVTVRVVAHLRPVAGVEIVGRVASPHVIEIVSGYETSARLIAHELVHVIQWHRTGVGYPLAYVLQVVAYGYWDAPFEVEARAMEADGFYLDWARDIIAAL